MPESLEIPPSTARSGSSAASRHSHRSARSPPPINTNVAVVTTPPWAKDEPPSPRPLSPDGGTRPLDPSDATSSRSSFQQQQADLGSTWWSFTSRQRPTASGKSERPRVSFKDRSISWLPNGPSSARPRDRDREKQPSSPSSDRFLPLQPPTAQSGSERPNLDSLPLPDAPFTLAQNATPGWETPWSAGVRSNSHDGQFFGDIDNDSDNGDANKNLSVWKKRRKNFRVCVLTNTYVPLMFRFINITFTTAALGLAIRIRRIELNNNVLGALGSSPTLVIIFAPPTLVHVIFSVYLEYFGRPLGLWRTSAKLAHTLFEVLFICAWSAALSLTFDNYFTSIIPCTGPSSISWYSSISLPESTIQDLEGGVGSRLCNTQLSLISLVLVGLLMYCINLIISLYRIFDKVKLSATSVRGARNASV
ncbi:hypothetical protein BDV98DRAFT_647638 [Pterulicium gracile]|uniref:Uncharacterized protein n=1 Tax=Pterulicium gracile TaxID=1884261 RepID=A0A5C3QX89_9AGAR|nr:hypothetical protein BDV98DRAFT_647638 [Pterula gracilis]